MSWVFLLLLWLENIKENVSDIVGVFKIILWVIVVMDWERFVVFFKKDNFVILM